MLAPPTSVVIEEVVSAERQQQGKSPSLVEPSGALVWVGTGKPQLEWSDLQNPGAASFVLDDPAEEKEWRSYHSILMGVALLMNKALATVNDGLI